jgi:hypothetical protein
VQCVVHVPRPESLVAQRTAGALPLSPLFSDLNGSGATEMISPGKTDTILGPARTVDHGHSSAYRQRTEKRPGTCLQSPTAMAIYNGGHIVLIFLALYAFIL